MFTLICRECADSSGSDPTTIFVKGFDKYQGEEDVRQALTEVFQDCGEIASVRLPTDRETQELKGIAFIQFAAPEGKVSFYYPTARPPSNSLTSLHLGPALPKILIRRSHGD